jgi:hypothetical protein
MTRALRPHFGMVFTLSLLHAPSPLVYWNHQLSGQSAEKSKGLNDLGAKSSIQRTYLAFLVNERGAGFQISWRVGKVKEKGHQCSDMRTAFPF